MTEDLFKFMLIKGVDENPEDLTLPIAVSPEISESLFLKSLEELSKSSATRDQFFAKAEEFKKSNDFIKNISNLTVDVMELDKHLKKHKKSLSRNDFLNYAEKSLFIVGDSGEKTNIKPKDLIESQAYKTIISKITNSIYALIINPDKNSNHRDILIKYLKLLKLIDIAVKDKWTFNKKFDYNDVLYRITFVLSNKIFPLPKKPIQKTKKDSNKDKKGTKKEYEKKLKDFKELESAINDIKNLLNKPELIKFKTPELKIKKEETSFFKKITGKAVVGYGEFDFDKDPSFDYVEKEVFDKLADVTKSILPNYGFTREKTNLLSAVTLLTEKASRLYEELTIPRYGYIVNSFVVPCEPLSLGPPDSSVVNTRLISNIAPNPTGMFYFSGIGDLEIVKQELKAYELGDFAHVENILAGEHKERTHRRLELTEEELTELEEKISESEKDTQSTERNEMQNEAEKVVNEEMSLEAGVTGSTYGPGYNITANVNGGFNRQTTSSSRRANNFSQSVVQRSMDRVKNKTLKELRRRKLQEIEETNVHGVNNAHPNANHIRGIYRWLNKIYDAQVFNYGKRHMFDFIIPEPASFYIWALTSDELDANKIEIPEEPTFGPSDISELNWRGKVKKYKAIGVKPPPGNKTFSWAKSGAGQQADYMNSDKISIDDGWEVHEISVLSNWVADLWAVTYVSQDIAIADTWANNRHWVVLPKNRHRHEIAVAHYGKDIRSYTLKVDVICHPTEEAKRQWQVETFEAIMDGYRRQVSEHEDKLASAAIGEGIAITGLNPELNKKIIQNELQRCCLSLITENNLEDFNPFIGNDSENRDYWRYDFNKVKELGIDVRFLQQAFEWHNMTYIFYPSFWGRASNWAKKLIQYDDPDPNFAAFLRAGAARVQVPVREGFEEAVIYFAQTGELPDGTEGGIIEDDLYLSAINEVKETLNSLDNLEADPAGPWEVKTPTSLIVLQDADNVQFLDSISGNPVTIPFNNSLASDNGDGNGN